MLPRLVAVPVSVWAPLRWCAVAAGPTGGWGAARDCGSARYGAGATSTSRALLVLDDSAVRAVGAAVRLQTSGITSEAQRDFSRSFFADALAAGALRGDTVAHVVTQAVSAGDAVVAAGAAVAAGVPGITSETLREVHARCVAAADSDAAEAALRVAEAAGVPRAERRAWVAAAAVADPCGTEALVRRSEALSKLLAVRRGGLGTDAAMAMCWRLLDLGTADAEMVERVARGACFSAAEVARLVARSLVAGLTPTPGTFARLAEAVVVSGHGDVSGTATRRAELERVLDEAEVDTVVRGTVHTAASALMAQISGLPPSRLEKLRLDALRHAFVRGERGFDAAEAMFEGWCAARVVTPGLARFAVMNQHFSERGHEKVLRRMVASGIEPDSGVYAALVTRHRLDGDEEGARRVLENMGRTGVPTSGDALRAAVCAPDDLLMRQRLALIARKAGQGPRGLTDGLAAAEAMVQRGRADGAIVGLAIKHCINAGDAARAWKLYDAALHGGLFVDAFRPPLRGSTTVSLSNVTAELGTISLARHFEWLHGEAKRVPAVGAWCHRGVVLHFDVSSRDPAWQARTVQTAVAVTVFLMRLPLRCAWCPNLCSISIKGSDLRAWAAARPRATIAQAILPETNQGKS